MTSEGKVDVFISFSGPDRAIVWPLIAALTARLGPAAVWCDEMSKHGTTFPADVHEVLRRSQLVLAFIGPRWSAAAAGPVDDFVRREVAEALRLDVPVLPVLISGAVLPPASELPADIAALASRHCLRLDTRPAAGELDRPTERIATYLGRAGTVPDIRTEDAGPAVPLRRRLLDLLQARRRKTWEHNLPPGDRIPCAPDAAIVPSWSWSHAGGTGKEGA